MVKVTARINFNEYVRVRLNEHGLKQHRKWWDSAGLDPKRFSYNPPKADSNGWSKWQIWHLMEVFGPSMRIGGDAPFVEGMIEFEVSHDDE